MLAIGYFRYPSFLCSDVASSCLIGSFDVMLPVFCVIRSFAVMLPVSVLLGPLPSCCQFRRYWVHCRHVASFGVIGSIAVMMPVSALLGPSP